MATQTQEEKVILVHPARIDPYIVAVDVSEADYMEHYAATHHERVRGIIYKMPPIHQNHYFISRWLARFFEDYLELRPIGQIREDPFVMRLSTIDVQRQPDVQVILGSNLENLKPTYMDGPADICVEVVSLDSVKRDRGEKYTEYEQAGVTEYWIIDPLSAEAMFNRLNGEGKYKQQPLQPDDTYQTPLLPDFKLHVPTLWQDPLPTPSQTLEMVRRMLNA